ncbi:uncharacterized protein PHACADRAFT_262510 [Phanerochaete carnosa HHB-10118-sp]|uniref:Uncharacterized protein n=1 Tax=Phanerochaete carnosa (strain HHB-10118-sp) TaxID=650164 RepID=K5VKX9_PHACS|nr:uncharacterized protein PHACADRAFT_262510 [Phanerochaete carnosa HHB-10118-sp]EKM52058.1 hypothetical protein PHACADRAFT_262510 [Phanerochaete carnosa HHB-10118-sp]
MRTITLSLFAVLDGQARSEHAHECFLALHPAAGLCARSCASSVLSHRLPSVQVASSTAFEICMLQPSRMDLYLGSGVGESGATQPR